MFPTVLMLVLSTTIGLLSFRSGFRYAACFFARHPEILELYRIESGRGQTQGQTAAMQGGESNSAIPRGLVLGTIDRIWNTTGRRWPQGGQAHITRLRSADSTTKGGIIWAGSFGPKSQRQLIRNRFSG